MEGLVALKRIGIRLAIVIRGDAQVLEEKIIVDLHINRVAS